MQKTWISTTWQQRNREETTSAFSASDIGCLISWNLINALAKEEKTNESNVQMPEGLQRDPVFLNWHSHSDSRIKNGQPLFVPRKEQLFKK